MVEKDYERYHLQVMGEDKIKTYFRDMGGGVEWIHLAQNMQQWLFLLNMVMNGQVS